MRLWGLVLVLALAGGPAMAAEAWRAPRTASGAPDLQGVWTNTSVTWLQRTRAAKGLIPTDAEIAMMEQGFAKLVEGLTSDKPIDPNAPAPPVAEDVDNADYIEMSMKVGRVGGQPRSSWIVEPEDGRLPFTDAGKAATARARKSSYEGPETRPTDERCLTAIGSPEGPPMMNAAFNGHYQIVQTRDHVAILVEMNHDVRIIRLTDHSPTPAAARRWMGESVGHWEGETLVVETTNLERGGAYVSSLGGGFAYSPDARVIERFTRTGKDEIRYEFTVDDPVTFSRPWRAEMSFRPAAGPIYEYACHEGNYSLGNILGGARAEEKAAGK